MCTEESYKDVSCESHPAKKRLSRVNGVLLLLSEVVAPNLLGGGTENSPKQTHLQLGMSSGSAAGFVPSLPPAEVKPLAFGPQNTLVPAQFHLQFVELLAAPTVFLCPETKGRQMSVLLLWLNRLNRLNPSSEHLLRPVSSGVILCHPVPVCKVFRSLGFLS